MELKVQEILTIGESLKEFDKKELPSKLSYWLGRLEDKIEPVIKRYNKERDRLILEKHGVKIEDTMQFQVPKENIEAFSKDILDLLDQKETIEISLPLELFDGVNVSKEFFKAMGDIIRL